MDKKVTLYYGGFLGGSGGAFMHSRSMKSVLENHGWLVDVVTLDNLPIYVRYLPHILSHLANWLFPPVGYFYKGRLTRFLYRLYFDDQVSLRIFEDIYISWNSSTPSVTILHAVWSDNLQSMTVSEEQKSKLIDLEAKVINAIQHPVVTVSSPYWDYLISEQFSKHSLRKIDVIPLGINVADFDVLNDRERDNKSIVYCGSLEARKNVYFLLQVFKRLYLFDKGYKLTLIGGGPDAQVLQGFCADNKLPVTFLGRLAHDRVREELRRHHIYLHTSLKESFSFALLEAKLSGLVTCAYSGLEVPREFIDIPVHAFDVDEWFQAIISDRPACSCEFDRNKYSAIAMASDTLKLVNCSLV